MTWQEVCDDPSLHDLPYKIELDKLGRIVMSPASNWHVLQQSKIFELFIRLMSGGRPLMECSVDTPEGTKVADVAWVTAAFMEKYEKTTPYPVAPAIWVEVISPSNTKGEIAEKKKLLFDKGAREVWTCDPEGQMEFYKRKGKITRSKLAPEFPTKI